MLPLAATLGVTGTLTANTISYSNIAAPGYMSAVGNVTGGNILTAGLMSATGNITGGNLSVGTGTVTVGNIVNSNGNGVGNIGSSSLYFNTAFVKATSAQYADLAEMYCADAEYAPGTLLEFGGDKELTITTETHSTKTAGIVSTNPSYLMNSTLDCVNAVELALVGRVPTQVVGTIRKGDRLVASKIPGVATVLNMALYQPGCIVGKALEDYNSQEVGIIEVAVGRL
jgi:trimeric autotransporter adhesin